MKKSIGFNCVLSVLIIGGWTQRKDFIIKYKDFTD